VEGDARVSFQPGVAGGALAPDRVALSLLGVGEAQVREGGGGAAAGDGDMGLVLRGHRELLEAESAPPSLSALPCSLDTSAGARPGTARATSRRWATRLTSTSTWPATTSAFRRRASPPRRSRTSSPAAPS